MLNCISCKGKFIRHCQKKCPYNEYSVKSIDSLDFQSASPPSIFIGSQLHYPAVNVGIISPPPNTENPSIYDSPSYWSENNYSIQNIVDLRKNLINSRFQTTVHSKDNKFINISQEIGMAYKPVDAEISIIKKPLPSLDFDSIKLPIGSSASLKNIKLIENPKIETKVDKVVSDIDLKAGEALNYLYKNKFDVHFLSQLLSIGVLGIKKNRKFVPTRFSITATDDTIGKKLIEEIKDYSMINEYSLFCGNYLGNYYIIMFFPEVWSYELFELYLPHSSWNPSSEIKISTDQEEYFGRKTYAKNCAGGYYASRISCLEYLSKIKRQASTLVIRFETPEYNAPLGVWVVRKAASKSLSSEKITFESKEKMLEYAKIFIKTKFNYNLDDIYKRSIFINKIKTQTKLMNFL